MDFIMNAKTFKLGNKTLHLHFATLVGSKLHRLNTDLSDSDFKFVFSWSHKDVFSLEDLPNSLQKNNTNKEEWDRLVSDVCSFLSSRSLSFSLDDCDDFAFFESKHFLKNALKNDFNMLDMLFSPLEPLFCSNEFKEVLSNKNSFLDVSQASVRFRGMAQSSLKLAKKLNNKENPTDKEKNDFLKSSAKSLQFLFSLLAFLETHTHSPVLPDEFRFEVLNVKRGLVSFDEVLNRFFELDKVLNDELKKSTWNKQFDLSVVNRLSLLLNFC